MNLRLMRTWKNLFGDRFFNQYEIEDFPMLIGVRRAELEEITRFSPPDYRFELLMKGHRLKKDDEVVTDEGVLNELKAFKEKFDQTEFELVSEEQDRGRWGKINISSSRRLPSNEAVDCVGM